MERLNNIETRLEPEQVPKPPRLGFICWVSLFLFFVGLVIAPFLIK